MTRTKIVATFGPACNDPKTVRAMLEAGLDVARINFSHGLVEEHARRLSHLRSSSQRPIAILGDLCGPKIRVAALPEGGLRLEAGDELVVLRAADRPLGPREMTTSYPGLVDDVSVGDRLLIDDGAIQCLVTEKRHDRLVCQCHHGGQIGPRKGVNLPDSTIKLPVLTEKDLADLDWAVGHELDYIGLSFARSADDVIRLRDEIHARGGCQRIIVKIETPAAVRNIDSIIQRADGILIARGDLGVEMDLVEVPILQKDLVRRCRAAGVPVIVATQMLQSMTEAATPTRAEVSDVANAILDGSDAVMLSAETAVGRDPPGVVAFMNRIIARTEAAQNLAPFPSERVDQPSLKVTSAVARTAAIAAREHNAKAVAVWTRSGNTARLVSKHHLSQPILAFGPDERVCRQLALLAGVIPAQAERPPNERTLIRTVDREVVRRGLAQRSDMIVIVAGTDQTTAGASDAVILHFVNDV